MPNLFRVKRALTGLALALSAAYGCADTVVNTPIAGMQAMPQFPPSSAVLQTAVNNLNQCVEKATADGSSATTTDAVMSQCATAQAQLQQMLPPALFDKSVTDTRQRVTNVLTSKGNTSTAP